jgi:hypothetical protein
MVAEALLNVQKISFFMPDTGCFRTLGGVRRKV